MSKSLESQLKPIVQQRYPGFEKHFIIGSSRAYSFAARDCREWHATSWDRIHSTLGSGVHLPVFRISHGEFILAIGYRMPRISGRSRTYCLLGTTYINLRKRLRLTPAFFSGSSSNSWETFTHAELAAAHRTYVASLQQISREGMLAAAFYDNPGFNEYFPAYFRWLEKRNVVLMSENYMPFYSVYVGMAGDDIRRLVQGRRVLVVTSFPDDKEQRLRAALDSLDSESVQFMPVSASKAMFDRLDLDRVQGRIDVTLVGAGVGAAAILCQVKPLGSVALDVGFCLDFLAYPEKRWERPYCIPDAQFDMSRVRFLPEARRLKTLQDFGSLVGDVPS